VELLTTDLDLLESYMENKIIFGDNLTIMQDIAPESVDLIYIDPPFGTGDEYDGNKGQNAYFVI